jgi:hypothetical protein
VEVEDEERLWCSRLRVEDAFNLRQMVVRALDLVDRGHSASSGALIAAAVGSAR